MTSTGILLTNTGTPDAPTIPAVRRYLREFLSDKRIVHLPRWLWLPLLYGLILPIRSRRSAKLYQLIWTPEGSPMRIFMEKIAAALQKKLCTHDPQNTVHVEIGMNYGHPSIDEGLEKLYQKNIDRLLILPLFPQYSNATTAASFDRIVDALKKWSALPDVEITCRYYKNSDYIYALAERVRTAWAKDKPSQHLLISFHGLPERFIHEGDPYARECEETAALLAKALNLSKNQWSLCYQSRFGYAAWLKPSTQELLQTLPKRGLNTVDIICPGFSVDCLETLEEVALRGKQLFLNTGGTSLRYISALNDCERHIGFLVDYLLRQCRNMSN